MVMTFQNVMAAASLVVGILGLVVNVWNPQIAQSIVGSMWLYLFVNVWYIWLALSVYGAYRLGKFLRSWYRSTVETSNALAALTDAFAHEQKNRVAATDTIGGHISTLETRVNGSLK